MVKIQEAVFLEDYRLLVLLTDGSRQIYDMRPKLRTVRFYDLQDREIFVQGQIKNGQVIYWNNGSELSLDEILSDR